LDEEATVESGAVSGLPFIESTGLPALPCHHADIHYKNAGCLGDPAPVQAGTWVGNCRGRMSL